MYKRRRMTTTSDGDDYDWLVEWLGATIYLLLHISDVVVEMVYVLVVSGWVVVNIVVLNT